MITRIGMGLLQLLLTIQMVKHPPQPFYVDGQQVQGAWLGLAIAGLGMLGSYLSNRSANKNAQAANQAQQKQNTMVQGLTGDYMKGLGGPSQLEQTMLARATQDPFAGGMNFAMPEIPNAYRDIGLATDPILQSMRSGSNDAGISQNLMGLLNTGNPYDTGMISSALQPIRNRNLDAQLAEVFAAAPGLGQRFGSATRRDANELRRMSLEDSTAIDSQMLFQAHESAQARRLAAAGALTQRDQLQLGRDTGALQALLGLGNLGIAQGQNNIGLAGLGLDADKLRLAGRGQQDQMLAALLGSQGTRNNQILQAMGLNAGMNVTPTPIPGYGGMFGDMSQLLLMQQLLGGQSQNRGQPVTTKAPVLKGQFL